MPSHEPDSTVQPTPQLIDAIYRERVRRAQATPPGEKLLDGPELFDWACEIMCAGIRHQNPQADEEDVRTIALQRLQLQRRLETGP